MAGGCRCVWWWVLMRGLQVCMMQGASVQWNLHMYNGGCRCVIVCVCVCEREVPGVGVCDAECNYAMKVSVSFKLAAKDT
jgi:hypothetical protein